LKEKLCNCFLIKKCKCVLQFIHEHCPLKKKFWSKSCCTSGACCGPTYIGTMASPQGFFGSLQSAPISTGAMQSLSTPQASLLGSYFGGDAAASSPESSLALDRSAGTKAHDVAEGGDDLRPVSP
jgi:hypothetical protein